MGHLENVGEMTRDLRQIAKYLESREYVSRGSRRIREYSIEPMDSYMCHNLFDVASAKQDPKKGGQCLECLVGDTEHRTYVDHH